MTERYQVDLHDLVHVNCHADEAIIRDISLDFGDIPLVTKGNGVKTCPCQVQLFHSSSPLRGTGMRKYGPRLFADQDAMLDHEYAVRLSKAPGGTFELVTTASCPEWLIWTIQLGLLTADATFVHGAGLEKNGKALLFPSWGGVGKTALAESFVRRYGWRLLGDDLVVVGNDGRCGGFPKPMVLYPYHRAVFPEFFARGNRPLAPTSMNTLLAATAARVKPILRRFPRVLRIARRNNPQSIRVNPSRLFGQDALASSADVSTIVWLDRVPGLTEPQLKRADDSLPSRMVGSTLVEFDQHCVAATAVACGLGIVPFRDLYPKWFHVVEAAANRSQSWMLFIPAELPIEATTEVIHHELHRAGILESFESCGS